MSLRIFHELLDELENGNKAALAVLVRKSGSAPRDVGAAIVVTEDGRLLGSLGGGCMEAEVYETARKANKSGSFRLRKFSLSHDLAAGEGLVCGGTIWVAVFPCGRAQRMFFRQVVETASAEQASRLCLAMDEQGGSLFVYADEDSAITLCPAPPDHLASGARSEDEIRSYLAGHTIEGTAPALSMDGNRWLYHELLVTIPDCIIFGGGHISLDLVKIAVRMGFRTTVVDDRPLFANTDRFPEADHVVMSEFKTAWDKVTCGPEPYIIIVTRGHQHDDTVLREALRLSHAYIGMIGSKRKVQQILSRLKEEGVPPKALDLVYSPIGLNIGSETPAEIAVSILAEICAIRRRGHDPERRYGHMNRAGKQGG